MDEVKIIIWIIIGLVYLFSRRKKKPVPSDPSKTPESDQEFDAPAPQPVTFEELLREIQGKKKPAPVPQPIPSIETEKQPWAPFPYKVEERKQLEDKDFDYRDNDKIYEIYDNATKEAFNRPSLEETVKLKDTIVRFEQFKEYDTKGSHNLVEEYMKELKNPKGFKKAFIMSEILQRRF